MKIEYSEYNGKINIYSDNDSNLNCMNLKWNNGRMDINISNFLPCTVKDLNMFIDIVDKTEHARQHVDFLAAVLLETVNIIEKSIENSYDATAKAKRVAALNKWQRLYNALAKRFNLAKKENNAEQVKYKKAVVYPFAKWDDGKGARPIDGYAFEKYGFSLYVYKNIASGYHVILPGLGVSVCNGTSKAKAVAAFTPELASRVKKILAENDQTPARKRYYDYMAAAGLGSVLEDPFYNMPVFSDPEEETTPETATEKEPETIQPEKEPETRQKAAHDDLQSREELPAEKGIPGKPDAFMWDYRPLQWHNRPIRSHAKAGNAGQYHAAIVPGVSAGNMPAGNVPQGSAWRLCATLDRTLTTALYKAPQRNNPGMVYQYTKSQKETHGSLPTLRKWQAASLQPVSRKRQGKASRARGSPAWEAIRGSLDARQREALQTIPLSGMDQRHFPHREMPPPTSRQQHFRQRLSDNTYTRAHIRSLITHIRITHITHIYNAPSCNITT